MRLFSNFWLTFTEMEVSTSSRMIIDILLNFDSRKFDEDIIKSARWKCFPEGFHQKFKIIILINDFISREVFYVYIQIFYPWNKKLKEILWLMEIYPLKRSIKRKKYSMLLIGLLLKWMSITFLLWKRILLRKLSSFPFLKELLCLLLTS